MLEEYQERLAYLSGRLNYETQGMPRIPAELRLGRMRRLLRALGDPHEGMKIVHVAGTKGKGSTASMISASLSAAGFRTGLYASPHLHRLEERFRIDGRMISESELVGLVDEIREAVERVDRDDLHHLQRGSTFFEITTAMGLLHFARQRADAVVLEVGLGGRLDSTNVVHPSVSVITSIGFDHTRQLGNTLAAIAGEKAGIIKRDRPTVSGVREPEPRDVIRDVAKLRRSPIREVEVDYRYTFHPPVPPLDRPTPGTVSVSTWKTDWGTLTLPLLGSHQASNAALALAALDALAEVEPGLTVSRDAVVAGFSKLNWPARVEVFGESPWIVIDGAHNVASAVALEETLRECFPKVPRTLVFGTTKDKDLPGQLRALLPSFDRLIVTRYVENPRSVPPEDIARAIREIDGRDATLASDPEEALAVARRVTSPAAMICVTGSLFLAAETRALLLAGHPTPQPADGALV